MSKISTPFFVRRLANKKKLFEFFRIQSRKFICVFGEYFLIMRRFNNSDLIFVWIVTTNLGFGMTKTQYSTYMFLKS